ncbi:hypothetical protein HanHA300_Chr05g0163501 [Helianthus annuus]|nr:hypothetical protein HanHA300_Chr05g0163501 [Helianthus annuus]KAJ0575633.1 hypothetical protein HanIR_Chr05g0214951 [Helianthus annuus]KAJ0583511.1 hypothetical protein HanHA89_Chr05g0177411 [Helianthus annuus]KAJ0746246.1 hypothetical protein HanOQP8_Chr05g0175331 [Helianthus annuus]KAJ0749253.1 hypothetical protein HanLR1_Chr05g0167671 [Helianthus annuus]
MTHGSPTFTQHTHSRTLVVEATDDVRSYVDFPMVSQPVYLIPEGGSSPIPRISLLDAISKDSLARTFSFIFLSPLSDSYRNVDSVHTSS